MWGDILLTALFPRTEDKLEKVLMESINTRK